MKKLALYVLLLSFIAIPAAAAEFKVRAGATDYTQDLNPPPFNKIDISGSLNVYIDGGSAKSFVHATGDQDSLRYVTAIVRNGTLYLGMKPGYIVQNGRLSVIIHKDDLTQIRYTGSGQITATNLKERITIIDEGTGPMNLRGKIILQDLVYNGRGTLSMYWIDSTNVTISGNGNGKVYLAGVAGLLDIRIGGHTWVDAKQLHARRGFIKTNDSARADVWVRDSLSTLAQGHSNIYYYHDAGFVGAYMVPPAVSLRMYDIDKESEWRPRNCCDDSQVRS